MSNEAGQWLQVFQKSEPDVQFSLSVNKPSQPPKGSGPRIVKPRRPKPVRLKYTDDTVRRMLEHMHFSDELLEAAKERGLNVSSVSERTEVKTKLQKYFHGRTAASAADAKKFDRYISLAADDIANLRKSDVFRVLNEAKSPKELLALSAYITGKRSDLKSSVEDDAQEVTEEKGW